jgi:hypothetical protein
MGDGLWRGYWLVLALVVGVEDRYELMLMMGRLMMVDVVLLLFALGVPVTLVAAGFWSMHSR